MRLRAKTLQGISSAPYRSTARADRVRPCRPSPQNVLSEDHQAVQATRRTNDFTTPSNCSSRTTSSKSIDKRSPSSDDAANRHPQMPRHQYGHPSHSPSPYPFGTLVFRRSHPRIQNPVGFIARGGSSPPSGTERYAQVPSPSGLAAFFGDRESNATGPFRCRLMRVVTIHGEKVGTNTGTYVCGREFREGLSQVMRLKCAN